MNTPFHPPGQEAQRLVAVSLGKIAASRSTRSGIRLHKSLMVSTVLFRARTAVIMEKYSGTRSSSSDEEDDEEVEQNTTTAASSTPLQTTDIDDYDQSELSDNEDEEEYYDEPEDSEPAQVVPQVGDNTRNINNNSDSSTDCDKENVEQTTDNDDKKSANDDNNKLANDNNNVCHFVKSPRSVLSACENTTQNLDSQVISKCERCTKRRLTEVEEAVDSISPCKRQRSSEDEYTSSSSDEENQLESSALEVPMEGIQITNLVDSFSSGFSGLLSTSEENNTNTYTDANTYTDVDTHADTCVTDTLNTVIGVTDSITNVMEKCGYKPSPKPTHTLTEAFNHCSTQIKESFDTLTSTLPISLSV